MYMYKQCKFHQTNKEGGMKSLINGWSGGITRVCNLTERLGLIVNWWSLVKNKPFGLINWVCLLGTIGVVIIVHWEAPLLSAKLGSLLVRVIMKNVQERSEFIYNKTRWVQRIG